MPRIEVQACHALEGYKAAVCSQAVNRLLWKGPDRGVKVPSERTTRRLADGRGYLSFTQTLVGGVALQSGSGDYGSGAKPGAATSACPYTPTGRAVLDPSHFPIAFAQTSSAAVDVHYGAGMRYCPGTLRSDSRIGLRGRVRRARR